MNPKKQIFIHKIELSLMRKMVYVLIVFISFSCSKSLENNFQGRYRVSLITVDNVDMTISYSDTCNCDFFFPEPGYDYFELYNCKGSGLNTILPGSYSISDKMKKFGIRIFEKTTYYDSVFGFGPLNYGIKSNWEIRDLTSTELIIETNFDNKYYRLELSE